MLRRLLARLRPALDDRGDVPGWVLVTVVTVPRHTLKRAWA